MVQRMIEEIDRELKDTDSKLHGFRDVYRVSFDINIVKDYGYVRLRLINHSGETIKTMNIGRIDLIDDVDDLKRLLRHKLWYHGFDDGISPEDIVNIRLLHERKRKLAILRSNLKYLLNGIDYVLEEYKAETKSFEQIIQRLREKARAKGVIM